MFKAHDDFTNRIVHICRDEPSIGAGGMLRVYHLAMNGDALGGRIMELTGDGAYFSGDSRQEVIARAVRFLQDGNYV